MASIIKPTNNSAEKELLRLVKMHTGIQAPIREMTINTGFDKLTTVNMEVYIHSDKIYQMDDNNRLVIWDAHEIGG